MIFFSERLFSHIYSIFGSILRGIKGQAPLIFYVTLLFLALVSLAAWYLKVVTLRLFRLELTETLVQNKLGQNKNLLVHMTGVLLQQGLSHGGSNEVEVGMKFILYFSPFLCCLILASVPVTFATKQTMLNFPLYSWYSVRQKLGRAQQGWLFLRYNVWRHNWKQSGWWLAVRIICRLIHAYT